MNIETVNELIASLESAGELSIREQKFLKLAKAYQQLAAENVAQKSFGDKLCEMHNALNGEGTGIQGRAEVACQQVALEAAMEEFDAIETPATDRIVAGIKADGVEALQKVARIRLDMNGFDGDIRGIADCLCDAEEALIEVVNRRAAMLQELQKSAGADVICRSNENAQVLNIIKAPPALDSLPKTGEVQNTNPPENPGCWCRTCRPVVLNDMRFVVCPDCGNKRCPRANDHRNACTGSNEPGQEGSAYPDTLQEPKP
nr:hypothetical protein [Klebsiella pneumoniae]